MNKIVKSNAFFEQIFVFTSLVITTLAFGFYYLVFHKIIVTKDVAVLLHNGLEYLKTESIFFSKSLVISYFKEYPVHGFGYLICSALFCFWFKNKLSWKFFKVSRVFRLLLLATALIFVYNNALSSYNYFTEQWYFIERSLLLLSAILVYYTPLAMLVYLPVLFLSFASFNFPFDSFSITDKLLPYTILTFTLCSSMMFLISSRVNKNIRYERMWLLGCLIIVCCSYLSPVLMKVKISPNYFDWFLVEDFTLAFRQYLARGWLLDLNSKYVDSIKQILESFQVPFLLFAFIIEFLGLFLFFKRRYSIFILVLFILLNTGVFFLSAIFFWKWIVFNALLIVYLHKEKPAFNFGNSLSMIVICILFSLFSPLFPKLGWYSIPYSLNYKLKVIDLKDVEEQVQGKDMAPFDIYFTFSRWEVFDKKQLTGYSLDPAEVFLTKEMNITQLKDYQRLKGINKFNGNALKVLEIFLLEYFQNFNTHLKSPHWFLKPFSHIQAQSNSPFVFDRKIKSIEIIAEENWFSASGHISKEHIIKILEF